MPLMTPMDSSKVARLHGFRPITLMAESPRPMAQTVRSPNMSFSVANTEAVTVQSRVPGFVTIGPTIIFWVAASMALWITNGSCQSTWLSNVYAWVNPRSSAFRASSTTRHAGGSVCITKPKSIS